MKNILIAIVLLISISSLAQQKKQWTLEECVNYALENNITIKQSQFDTEIADQNVKTAKGNFLPTANASASQTYNFGSFIDNNGSRISRDSRGNSFGVNTSVTVFNGFQNTHLSSQAKLGLEASKLQLDILKDNISLNVVNNYLNVLFNKESLRIADDQIKVTNQQFSEMNELVNSGVRARADLLEIQAQLASNKENVVKAKNSVDLALLSLAQLLQISHVGFDVVSVVLDLDSFQLRYSNADVIYNVASEERPEIKSAELDIENSELNIKLAKSNYMPFLGFSAGVGTSYQHSQGREDVRLQVDINDPDVITLVPNGFSQQIEDNLGYNFGFNLNVPIFNGTRTKANVNRAIISKKRTVLALEQQKQDLRSNIENSFADANAALNQFEASKASVIAQEEAFRNAKESYDLGVMTSFEFEQVRNRLVSAQSALINAKYNFVFKTKVLDFYNGIPLTN